MKLGKEDGLLIVDAQQDFFPGGSLAVQEGDAILPVLHRWIERISAAGGRLYATRDWHPRDHISFKSRGGPWPPHCVQDTPGAELHPRLHLPAHAMILNKGTHPDRDNYSGFEIPELAQAMRRDGMRRLWIGGLAQDVCVRASVLDALRAGFEVHVLVPATRPVDPEAGRRALEEMERAGAILERET